MKKNYALGMFLMLALMLASFKVVAQPDVDKTIIFVGQYESATITEPRAEDQVALDSISQWVNVVFMDAGVFNEASKDELYGEGGTHAEGIIISESIGSTSVPNFGIRDDYPVPCIVMEGVMTGDPEDLTKWPLLLPDPEGGIWGYAAPAAEDVQWKIVDDYHYVTNDYNIGDIINYAPSPDRGVPYLHGISPNHLILAVGGRTAGGADNPTYVQDQAIALGYIEDPEILYMNVAYTYLAVASVDFYNILHKGVKFMFEAFPVGVDRVRSEASGLSVFPNPAANQASVRFTAEAGKKVSVNMYSLTGALEGNVYQGISNSGENEIQLNISGYSSGLYMVELDIDKEVSYSKFVLKR